MENKKAVLVYVSMVTRVIVDVNASEEEIIEKSRVNFLEKVNSELGENLEEIVDDTECPFGSIDTDTQIELDNNLYEISELTEESISVGIIQGAEIKSGSNRLKNAIADFLDISVGDIEKLEVEHYGIYGEIKITIKTKNGEYYFEAKPTKLI